MSFLDTLLQHIWVTHLQPRHQLQEYQELIEKVKLTPRIWNSAVKFNNHLRYLSSNLGLSINLIRFKRTHSYHNDNYQCVHKQNCFIPYYKFQNPSIRFHQDPFREFFQINILEFKSEYYSISSTSCNPLLINQLANFNFYHKSEPVTMHDINAILTKKPVENKSFSILLYSTSSYVRSCHTKIISNNIIGYLQNNSEDILHLFLTPHLHGPAFDVHALNGFPSMKNITFNPKNLLCNTHITEGKYDSITNSHPNKELLNQEHCICEHPDTERYFAPNNKSFRPLGKTDC